MTLKKIGLILTTALLLLSGSGCALFQSKKQAAPAPEAQAAVTEVQKAFDAFLMEETRRQLTQDGLTLPGQFDGEQRMGYKTGTRQVGYGF